MFNSPSVQVEKLSEKTEGTQTHTHIPLATIQQKEQALRTDQVCLKWERVREGNNRNNKQKISRQATWRPRRSEKAHMQCREKKEIKTENKKTADLACWDNISIHALTSLIPDSTHSNYSLKMKTTTRSIHILAKRKNRKKKLKKWQGGNTEQKRWKKATLKNHKDVERSWMCCILSLYLFISVSCLGVTHPLKLSAAPNWNQISGRP